ncbi:MAG: hypothetical protein IAF94_24455 [Pirellulaceae bacterium]|nr:hypothetical protein [Pirellulaceae bacterium]
MATSSSAMPTIDAETFYALSTRVEELSNRVQTLEGRGGQCQPDAMQAIADPFSTDRIDQVLKVTQSLFSGPVTTHMMSDPSEPQYPWMVFRVEQDMEYEEFRETMDRWYDRVAPSWPDDPTVYSLMVDPVR